MSADTCVLPSVESETKPRWIVLKQPVAGLWFGGWLFTIGFADLAFWKGLLALVLWPYFLGELAR